VERWIGSTDNNHSRVGGRDHFGLSARTDVKEAASDLNGNSNHAGFVSMQRRRNRAGEALDPNFCTAYVFPEYGGTTVSACGKKSFG